MEHWRGAMAASLLATLCACADMPGPAETADVSSAQSWSAQRRQQALANEAGGDLEGALQKWRIVHALTPDSREVNEHIRRLESAIAARSEGHTHAARASMSKHEYQAAQLHSLRALALEPRNEAAMTMLRRARARTTLAALPESPVPERQPHATAAAPTTASTVLGHASRDEDQGYAIEAGAYERHLQLASQYYASGELESMLHHLLEARSAHKQPDPALEGRIEETKAALATQYYDEGVRLFRKNLDESIAAFEKALEYDPGHTKAQLYLASARRLAAGAQ